MRRLFDRLTGRAPGETSFQEAYADLSFPEGPGDRPYTWVNMIVSLDGKAVFGPPGSTWKIGSEVDHQIFKELRRHADAVVTGAGVMLADDVPYPRIDAAEAQRREGAGLRPRPLYVIVSGRATLPSTLRVFAGGRENVLVVVTGGAPLDERRRLDALAQVLVLGQDTLDMKELGRVLLNTHGVRRLYSIGGPTLNGAMLEAGTLDELFFTLAPKIHGGRELATMVEGPNPAHLQEAELLSLYQEGDELFLRYAVSPHACMARTAL